MDDAADDATIIDALLAAYIGRQMRLDLFPLLIAQPKQVLSHHPTPRYKKMGLKESLTDSRLNCFIGF